MLLEARKDKETGFSLKVPEGKESCQQLDFNPLMLLLHF